MKVLVYPHDLAIGGSQLNAIEIAAMIKNAGHSTVVFGRPGTLNARIEQLGLEFIEAPDPGRRPSLRVARALIDLVDDRGIDVLHGYEWPPVLECLLASRRRPRVVTTATVMSMAVAPFIPKPTPLLVGTEQIAAAERAFGRTAVQVLEPPVDLSTNGPDLDLALDVAAFRDRFQLVARKRTIVCVTRLGRQLKLEGILSAMDAVGMVSRLSPSQLVVVGDGPARAEVRAAADAANARYGAGTVILTGELADPRAAYATADVTLGMGGSALRAMAFAKPLVVQGENGFWRLLTAESLEEFLWSGWYGYGSDASLGALALRDVLMSLLADPDRCATLGAFGRSVVEERFSMERAAGTQIAAYETALAQSRCATRSAAGDLPAAARFAAYHFRRRARNVQRSGSTDDFNSRPVARQSGGAGGPVRPRRTAREGHTGSTVVYLSGTSWDAVAGTDRHLVTSLSQYRNVLWVDPPTSWLARRRRGITVDRVSDVSPSIVRLHTVVPPGVSRPIIRYLSRRLVRRNVHRLLQKRKVGAAAVMTTSPEPVLGSWRKDGVFTVYYATDDFVAGAALLGYSTRYVKAARRKNLHSADLALAVSAHLARILRLDVHEVSVLANGCEPDHFAQVPQLAPAPDVDLPRPIAGLIGQLNDRLDPELLEAVADSGDSLLLVGPRYEETVEMTKRLNELVERPNVQWTGRRPFDRLPEYLAAIDVGLTPYADNAFNRASFPLKTMEYLAAGRPVVTTDLPSARELDTALITRISKAQDFADAVHRALKEPQSPGLVAERQCYARQHSWSARAEELDRLLP